MGYRTNVFSKEKYYESFAEIRFAVNMDFYIIYLYLPFEMEGGTAGEKYYFFKYISSKYSLKWAYREVSLNMSARKKNFKFFFSGDLSFERELGTSTPPLSGA